jgi:hypothetical protein
MPRSCARLSADSVFGLRVSFGFRPSDFGFVVSWRASSRLAFPWLFPAFGLPCRPQSPPKQVNNPLYTPCIPPVYPLYTPCIPPVCPLYSPCMPLVYSKLATRAWVACLWLGNPGWFHAPFQSGAQAARETSRVQMPPDNAVNQGARGRLPCRAWILRQTWDAQPTRRGR